MYMSLGCKRLKDSLGQKQNGDENRDSSDARREGQMQNTGFLKIDFQDKFLREHTVYWPKIYLFLKKPLVLRGKENFGGLSKSEKQYLEFKTRSSFLVEKRYEKDPS